MVFWSDNPTRDSRPPRGHSGGAERIRKGNCHNSLAGSRPRGRGPFVSAKGPKTISARARTPGFPSPQCRIIWLRNSLQGLFKKARSPARSRSFSSAKPGPARPQAARSPRRTEKYVEGFERERREERQVCEPEGRERRWRTFSTTPPLKQSSPNRRIRHCGSAAPKAVKASNL